jgi:hypothetical protein
VSTTSTSTPAATSPCEPPQRVLARDGVLDHLLDVLDRDEPLQPEVPVDDEELFDLVLVKDLARLVERRADGDGDEVLPRHDVGNRPVHVRLEPEVAVGQDADEPALLAAVLRDRHAGDPVFLHQIERLVDAPVGRERDRIDDHAAFRTLHPIDLRGLLLDRQVLVDHAEPALLRHRDGESGLGHRVHGGAHQRHVEADVPRQPRRHVDLGRQDVRMLRHEQHVVERERGGDARFSRRECNRSGLEIHHEVSRRSDALEA